MKNSQLTQTALGAKTIDQLMIIADSLHLTVTDDMSNLQIINLILDFQEADEDVIDITGTPAEKIPVDYGFTEWDEDEDEEIIYFRKPSLRSLTGEEKLALKMKRLELQKEAKYAENPNLIYQKVLIIDKLVAERNQIIESVSNKMEEEAYITY